MPTKKKGRMVRMSEREWELVEARAGEASSSIEGYMRKAALLDPCAWRFDVSVEGAVAAVHAAAMQIVLAYSHVPGTAARIAALESALQGLERSLYGPIRYRRAR